MLIKKQRTKPELLTSLELLDRRLTLHYREKQHLSILTKGYEGELLFDSLVVNYLTSEAIILNDLSLVIGSTPIQIDSLIVTSEALYLYEIKNYEGNYTDQSGQFRTTSGQDIVSPAGQLNRTTTVFTKLISQWEHSLRIVPNVVFVNSSFILYEAKQDNPYIFLPQLAPHFTDINRRSSTLLDKHYHIADRLLEESQKELPYQRKLPSYTFKELRKGLTCSRCGSFDLKTTSKSSHCRSCKHFTSLNELFLSEVKAFKFLFPEEQLTSNTMYTWCGGSLPKRRIRSILNTEFTIAGFAKSSHYI
ncbi:nuclease-related domain-containing protein [Alkalibacterium olivapovliticus]|uniref:Nuclease-like protein n=1 Tax=Alkalibacterium olivapovliticus TaxID=99907 RepID=A0A2T0W889_9LACT|nr:nuclease-related domain-containing protein [Alkalibacterium olivapovliticus]PRY82937.1 nuclease-like protein [Alkalibacterium olivapovliticus]